MLNLTLELKLPLTTRKLKRDRKSTRLNSSHEWISYAVFCLKKKKTRQLRLHERIGDKHIVTGQHVCIINFGDRDPDCYGIVLPLCILVNLVGLHIGPEHVDS